MKYVRKMFSKAKGAIKKRYTAKRGGRKFTGGVRVQKMAKDIMYLKSVLNPEKKRYVVGAIDQLVGQVNGNSDGGYYADVTPTPAQGITAFTRNGASIKLHSSIWHFQFVQQVGVVAKIRGVIEVWAMDGDSYTGFTFRDEHFDPNPFTGVRDFNCQINPDNYMKGKCIARRNFSIASDQTSSEKLVTDMKIPIKYNKGQGKHIRFAGDGSTIQFGQLYLIIRTDRGNIGAVSTLGVPDVNINTGLNMSWNRVDYFYDN